ncbi:MAG: large-conductance mechanosensitive channel protein MscL [Clostridia bacterium]|nr:large-conductance mechanosensitive channel protein MscL [Clostridia bacterium]
MKKNGFWSEFRTFISRGNVIDMAVGVIIGSAFTAIVTSLVNDLVMPLIGILFGGLNFTELKWVIKPAVGDIAESAIYYGKFLQSVVNFLLVALVIFSVVKIINSLHRKKEEQKEEPAPAPKEDPEDIRLLREIRDLLKKEG